MQKIQEPLIPLPSVALHFVTDIFIQLYYDLLQLEEDELVILLPYLGYYLSTTNICNISSSIVFN